MVKGNRGLGLFCFFGRHAVGLQGFQCIVDIWNWRCSDPFSPFREAKASGTSVCLLFLAVISSFLKFYQKVPSPPPLKYGTKSEKKKAEVTADHCFRCPKYAEVSCVGVSWSMGFLLVPLSLKNPKTLSSNPLRQSWWSLGVNPFKCWPFSLMSVVDAGPLRFMGFRRIKYTPGTTSTFWYSRLVTSITKSEPWPCRVLRLDPH